MNGILILLSKQQKRGFCCEFLSIKKVSISFSSVNVLPHDFGNGTFKRYCT